MNHFNAVCKGLPSTVAPGQTNLLRLARQHSVFKVSRLSSGQSMAPDCWYVLQLRDCLMVGRSGSSLWPLCYIHVSHQSRIPMEILPGSSIVVLGLTKYVGNAVEQLHKFLAMPQSLLDDWEG